MMRSLITSLRIFGLLSILSVPLVSQAAPQITLTFDCDLQGVVGKMTMQLEAIHQSGIVWEPGPNPDISAVIGTGEYIIYTAGEVVSPVARYVFTGENQFADFTEVNSYERFRVMWKQQPNGLIMIVNPFGYEPGTHFCQRTN